jgi:hypothetical protein
MILLSSASKVASYSFALSSSSYSFFHPRKVELSLVDFEGRSLYVGEALHMLFFVPASLLIPLGTSLLP